MKTRIKAADYPAIFEFYSQLERQRPLTAEESDRLALLVERYQRCLYQAAYRARHPEKAQETRDRWIKDPKNQRKLKKARRARYEENRRHESDTARAWRLANPERVKTNMRRSIAKVIEKREEARQSIK